MDLEQMCLADEVEHREIGPVGFVCLLQEARGNTRSHIWYVLDRRNEP